MTLSCLLQQSTFAVLIGLLLGGPLTAPRPAHAAETLDRLCQAAIETADGYYTSTKSFTYCAGGNVESAGGESYGYYDDSQAQAVSEILGPSYSWNLTYDDAGRLRHDERLDDGAAVESRDLTWTDAGCLASVSEQKQASDGSIVSDFTTTRICGPTGERHMRRTYDDLADKVDSLVVDIPGIGEIRIDGEDEPAISLRLPINGTIVLEDVRALDGGARDLHKSGWIHQDLRGSVVAKLTFEDVAADPAAFEARYLEVGEYDAWGNRLGRPEALPQPKHAFVGHEPDPGLGYYHFGKRVYDPSLRRWLSPDPLIFGAPEVDAANGRQLNLYAYAANNPVSATDTNGMYVESAIDVASIAVGVNSIRNWNEKTSFWTKVADVGGLALDGAALALPGVPGGAGLLIKGARAGENAVDAMTTVDRATDLGDTAWDMTKADNVATPGGPTFIVDEAGQAFPVPAGATGPTPVRSPTSGEVAGQAFTGGHGGANGQVTTMRLMDPTPAKGKSPGYPDGYVKYTNDRGQGVDPRTGKTGSHSDTHFPIKKKDEEP